MRKNLILISSYLPNSRREVFYHNEFVKIAPSFKKIILMYHYELPETDSIKKEYTNYSVNYLPSKLETILGIRFLFNPILLAEVYWLIKHGRFSVRKLFLLVGSYVSAVSIKNKISGVIKINRLRIKETSVMSYWCNNEAIALSLLKRKHSHLACSSRAHGYDVYEERNDYNYLPLRQFVFRGLDNILFVSEDGMLYSKKKYGEYASFRIIKIGVAVISKLPKTSFDDDILIVSCSNLRKVKRVDRIINTLVEIKNRKVKWVHFGDGDLKEELLRQANNLFGSMDNICYKFMGETTNMEILHFYQTKNVDCFINLSHSEGIPVSIMEAMAYGIPVIATNVGGVSEIVEDGKNGYLINESNLDYYNVASKIQSTKSNFSALSNSAQRMISEKYNIKTNISVLLNYL